MGWRPEADGGGGEGGAQSGHCQAKRSRASYGSDSGCRVPEPGRGARGAGGGGGGSRYTHPQTPGRRERDRR